MNPARMGILACSVLLGLGLVAPTLTIVPGAGELTWLVEIFSPEELVPTTYSIVGVISKLFDVGDWFLGATLFLFSVVFPVGKLALYWIASGLAREEKESSYLLKLTNRAGKFSMAEVFALALMVVVVKSLPGDSEAMVRWGAYVFVASVIGAIFVSFSFETSAKEKAH